MQLQRQRRQIRYAPDAIEELIGYRPYTAHVQRYLLERRMVLEQQR